jgi:hypothetical protein
MSINWTNPRQIDLQAVLQSAYGTPNASVKLSKRSITLRLPESELNPAYERTVSQLDGKLRALQWVILLANLLVLQHLAANATQVVILSALGLLSLWGLKALRVSFETRIGDQLTIVAPKNAFSNNELLAEAMIAFWAVRDSRPWLSAKDSLWHPDRGSNSIVGTMLSSLSTALKLAHDKVKSGDKEDRGGWKARTFYDQAITGAAAKISDLYRTWWRTIVIPGVINVGIAIIYFLYLAGVLLSILR